ncbi:MAG TPA: flagellar filament capping protein FliD [Vulgatibacter sp.]|nr:flagellar filament capping protein FliD [Vulgatibacter sp.]
MAATFVGGLASGIDSQLIIESIMRSESAVMDRVRAQQAATSAKISALGDIASRLTSIQDMAKKLADGGATATKVVGDAQAFSATAASGAFTGNYSLTVESIATAAKVRTDGFDSPSAEIQAGTLRIETGGQSYDLTIEEGATLESVLQQIRGADAPVDATIISDGTRSYLSVTNRETGHEIGGSAEALVLTFSATGSTGQALVAPDPGDPSSPATLRGTAQNAVFHLDGLRIERTGNRIDDLLPGLTLELKRPSAKDELGVLVPETLSIAEDRAATAATLQDFITAYNSLVTQAKSYMGSPASEAGGARIAGPLGSESLIRSLQATLQGIVTQTVPDASGAKSLGEFGVEIQRDGTLKLDEAKLNAALDADPRGLQSLFADSANGVQASLDKVVKDYTDPVRGYFTDRKNGLDEIVKSLGNQLDRMKENLNMRRAHLEKQFAALETTVSKYNALAAFLDQQVSQVNKK